MGFIAEFATFNTGTGAAGTTINVPLPRLAAAGLAPVVLRARIIGRTETTDAAGAASYVIGYGFAVSTSSRRATGAFYANGGSPSSSNNFHLTDCIIASSNGSVAQNGKLDVNSMSSVGTVQFIVRQQFASSLTIHLSVWAGSDISNASILNASLTANGDFTIAPGHPSRYVESLYPGSFTLDSVNNSAAGIGIGRTYIPDGVNQVFNIRSNNAVSPSYTSSYGYSGECIQSNNGAGGGGVRARITASVPTGFILQVVGSAAGVNYNSVSFLVVNGTFRCKMGDTTTETGSAVSSVDPGFVAECTDIWSHCNVKSTQFTMQSEGHISLGWFLGQFGTKQRAMGAHAVHNVSPMVVGTAIDFDAVYLHLDSSGALEGEGAIVALNVPTNPLGWDLQYSNPDSANNFLAWASFASADAMTTGLVADVVTSSLGSGSLTLDLPNLAAANLKPKVVKVTAMGLALGSQSAANADAGSGLTSVGWAVSPASQICYATLMAPGTPITQSRGRFPGSVLSDGSGSVAVTDMDTVGEVSLTATGTPNADVIYEIEVWGGSSIASATITAFNRTGGAGTQDIATGNAPRYAEMLGFDLPNGTDQDLTAALLSYGRCDIATLTNQVVAYAADSANTSNTASYIRTGEIHAEPSSTGGGSCANRFAISAASATGFTLNKIEADANTRECHVLSVAGSFDVTLGNLTTRTDQGAISYSHGISTPVKCLDAWSMGGAQSASDTTDSGAQLSIGAACSINTGIHVRSLVRQEPDAVVGGSYFAGQSHADLYMDLDTSGAIVGLLDAVTDTGLYMRDPDPSGAYVMIAAFGDGVAALGGARAVSRSWLNRSISKG